MRKHTNGLHSCLQTPARQTAAATIRRAHEMAIWRDMGERSTAVQSAEFLSQIFRHFTHITRCSSVHVTMAARLLSSKEPATAILLSSHCSNTHRQPACWACCCRQISMCRLLRASKHRVPVCHGDCRRWHHFFCRLCNGHHHHAQLKGA